MLRDKRSLAEVGAILKRTQMGHPADNVYGGDLELKFWPIIREMVKHIWPKEQPALKARVVAAIGLLVGSKVNIFGAA